MLIMCRGLAWGGMKWNIPLSINLFVFVSNLRWPTQSMCP